MDEEESLEEAESESESVTVLDSASRAFLSATSALMAGGRANVAGGISAKSILSTSMTCFWPITAMLMRTGMLSPSKSFQASMVVTIGISPIGEDCTVRLAIMRPVFSSISRTSRSLPLLSSRRTQSVSANRSRPVTLTESHILKRSRSPRLFDWRFIDSSIDPSSSWAPEAGSIDQATPSL